MIKAKSFLLPYENKWVALTPKGNKVITSDKTISGIFKKVKKLKNNKAIITKILSFDTAYSP
jgi:hypothetical protein